MSKPWTQNFGFFQLLKYFPIAYIVSDAKTYEDTHELTQYRHLNIDDEVEIPIYLEVIKHEYWPEAPDERNIIFGGQSLADSVSASPKERKKK